MNYSWIDNNNQSLGRFIWIDGLDRKTKKHIICGPYINWKQATNKADEICGIGNYDLYHTHYKTMSAFVEALKNRAKPQ